MFGSEFKEMVQLRDPVQKSSSDHISLVRDVFKNTVYSIEVQNLDHLTEVNCFSHYSCSSDMLKECDKKFKINSLDCWAATLKSVKKFF
jgi:hypothetical protein